MQEKINLQIDTSALQQEIDHYEKTLRQQYAVKANLAEEIDSLDPDDKHYHQRKLDLDERLYRMYDRIQETESALIECKAKKQAIEADKITSDNIYRILTNFDKLYAAMSDAEKHELLETLISEIHVYPDQKPSGQWIESIGFRLPILENSFEMSLDKLGGLETVMLLSKLKEAKHIDVELKMDELDVTEAERDKGATYEEIKAYVLEKTGLKVSSLNIAQVKQKLGIIERECYNKPKSEDNRQPKCPKEKEEAIEAAFKHYHLI